MADFDVYTGPNVPTMVRRIEVMMTTILEAELDENGVPTGTTIEKEYIAARAAVEDQYGEERWLHTARDYQALLAKGVVTPTQLQQLQAFLQNVRDTVETKLLPSE